MGMKKMSRIDAVTEVRAAIISNAPDVIAFLAIIAAIAATGLVIIFGNSLYVPSQGFADFIAHFIIQGIWSFFSLLRSVIKFF